MTCPYVLFCVSHNLMRTNGRRFLSHESQDPALAKIVEILSSYLWQDLNLVRKDSVHHHLSQTCLANQNLPLGQLAEIWKGGHESY